MKPRSILTDIGKSLVNAAWFMVLLFPLMVMKVNVSRGVAQIQFRWNLLPIVGIGAFVLSYVWRIALEWNERRGNNRSGGIFSRTKAVAGVYLAKSAVRTSSYLLLLAFVIAFPFLFGMYHTNVMITAFIYVILALGLNIIVGLGGLLNLGYAAFFGVGAIPTALCGNMSAPHSSPQASIQAGCFGFRCHWRVSSPCSSAYCCTSFRVSSLMAGWPLMDTRNCTKWTNSSALAISFNVIGRFSIDKATVNRFKNKKNSYHSTTLPDNLREKPITRPKHLDMGLILY